MTRPRQPSSTRGRTPAVCCGIIVAAGQGRRFGGPKQFVRVKGRPLLWYSMRAFDRCPAVTGYVVVTSRARIREVDALARRAGLAKLIRTVAGGRHRSDSVRNGLAVLPDQGLVAVHDAARPSVSAAMLALGFRTCRHHQAATFAIPVTDTLKRVAGTQIRATVDRDCLYAVQTPQFFDLSLLRRAHDQARRRRLSATDDCALVERLGVSPRIIPGSTCNIKVTTPKDLRLLKGLL